jgi:hypothetical protein
MRFLDSFLFLTMTANGLVVGPAASDKTTSAVAAPMLRGRRRFE